MRFLGNLVDWRQVYHVFVLGQIRLHTHKFQNSLMVIGKVIFIDKLIKKGCYWWLNGVVSWHKTELQFSDGESFVVTGVSFADLELSEWPLHRCCRCEGYCYEKLNPHHFYQLLYIPILWQIILCWLLIALPFEERIFGILAWNRILARLFFRSINIRRIRNLPLRWTQSTCMGRISRNKS